LGPERAGWSDHVNEVRRQVMRLQEAYLSTLVVVIGFPDTFFGRSFLRMLRMCKLSKVLASFVGSDKNTLCIFLLCSLTK
jgi:hypothetical protein